MTRSAAHLSDDALDRQIVAALCDMASDWPSVGAMVTALSASHAASDQLLAAQVEAFLLGWRPRSSQGTPSAR